MRLLFLSNEFPNAWEPTKATFNLDLIRQLSTNHDVSVLAPISWIDEVRARASGKGSLSRMKPPADGLDVRHARFWYTPGILRHHYEQFLWWSLRRSVKAIERKCQPDCVISYWAHPDGACAVRLARRLGVPSIVMVGGSDVLLMTKDARRRRCIQRALTGADAVVAVSRDLASKVLALDVDPKRVHVMRRGVDSAVFFSGDKQAARQQLGIPADETALLWVGRMVPVKGVETLVEAMAKLQTLGSKAKLYLVGGGPLRGHIEADVARLQLTDRVQFVGPVAHDDLGPWFRAVDATILPSKSEGIPNVLLESLACGTPWVASKVGGIPEIASGAATRMVAPNDPEELAQAIHQLLVERPTVSAADRPTSLAQFADGMAQVAESLRRGHDLTATCLSRPSKSRSKSRSNMHNSTPPSNWDLSAPHAT